MPRPLRPNYSLSWYHIFNRGAARRHIFVGDYAKTVFLHYLAEISEKFSLDIHAFCVMGNHYHLLVYTQKPNLSRAMAVLNSRYSRFYNQQRKKDGPIFKDRFKSILVQDESYLINLTRYIHLNPVESGLVGTPLEYEWSSCREFLNLSRRYLWLKTDLARSLMSHNYAAFLTRGNHPQISSIFSSKRLPSSL